VECVFLNPIWRSVRNIENVEVLPFGPLFATDLPVIEIERLGASVAHEDTRGIRTWDHTRRRFLRWEAEQVTPLSESLSPLDRQPTPDDLPLDGWLAASLDCRAVAALSLDRLVVAFAGTQTLDLPCSPGWHGRDVIGAVAFPWADPRAVAIIPTEDPATHRMLIIDTETGGFDHDVVLDSDHPAGFTIYGHPIGQGFVVEAGRGQDGTDLWSVQASEGRINVTSSGTWQRVFADFSPDGTEILTTPHYGDDLEIFSWPDWTPRAAVSADAVFAKDGNDPVDRFDFFAAYLTPHRILAKSTEYGGMVVIDRQAGTPQQRLSLAGLAADEDGVTPIQSFALLGGAHLLTWSWEQGTSSMDIWPLPESL